MEKTEAASSQQEPVSSSPLFAFMVTARDAEASVIAFAPSAAVAKSMAQGTLWLDGIDWIDLRATRLPGADKHATKQMIWDGSEAHERELMRSLGWYQVEGNSDQCRECELYEWDGIPESKLIYDKVYEEDMEDPICVGCKANV